MIEVILALLAEFAKGGLLVLLMAGSIVYLLLRGWYDRRIARKELAAQAAKYDAMRERMQEKFDSLIEKINNNLIHSTKQTEAYTQGAMTMINMVAELKAILIGLKDEFLKVAAPKIQEGQKG